MKEKQRKNKKSKTEVLSMNTAEGHVQIRVTPLFKKTIMDLANEYDTDLTKLDLWGMINLLRECGNMTDKFTRDYFIKLNIEMISKVKPKKIIILEPEIKKPELPKPETPVKDEYLEQEIPEHEADEPKMTKEEMNTEIEKKVQEKLKEKEMNIRREQNKKQEQIIANQNKGKYNITYEVVSGRKYMSWTDEKGLRKTTMIEIVQ